MKTLQLIAIAITILSLMSCATPTKQINWDDKRCVTYTDLFQKIKNQKNGSNKGAAFAAFLSGDYNKANTVLNGGGVQWVEGYSGDSKKVWVGYNELGETIGYKDINYTDLTLADLDELGGVITKYSNTASFTTTFQYKRDNYNNLPNRGMPFIAAPIPKECFLSNVK